jgi:long-chain acyl-CoA synthetase
VQVWINDRLRGKVAGDDFARALLRIWLGEHPADSGLKEALLGGN